MKSEFKVVLNDPKWSNELFRFLEVIFHLYPEDKFHELIVNATKTFNSDEIIYKKVLQNLPTIKPFLSEFTYALPALKKQKREMAEQVMKFLKGRTEIDGYLEIGSTGRYVSELRKHIPVKGSIYLTNDIAPDNSVADVFERGQLRKIGKFIPLTYQPISREEIGDEGLDVVACHIGLHHCRPKQLEGYIKSIHRILRKDGLFIMREHEAGTPEMATFVSLVHTVFNLGLKIDWETDSTEYKSFKSISEWSTIISDYGFKEDGQRILQDRDPSLNTLVCFKKL